MTDLESSDTEFAPGGPGGEVRPASVVRPGTVIDRYEVMAPCGSGAMGVVYRARDVRLGRSVAIKMLKRGAPETNACATLCSLLVREARILASLSHPHVINVYDVGTYRGCVYVAMEFVDGVTLREWAADPQRDVPARLSALRDAGDGLLHAHEHGVLHRDFKPDNVLVDRSGEVKVTDFGVARSTVDLASDADAVCVGCGPVDQPVVLPDADAIVGTPRYMAPELFTGAAADVRSDQHAFAVSAWEVLYGVPPFAEDSFAALVAPGARAEPAPPPAEPPVSEDVERALRRALRPEPSRRHASMKHLLAALA